MSTRGASVSCVARLADEPLAGPERDREDIQTQFVHKVMLQQRAQEIKVMVFVHTPGLDATRARTADDRNFEVRTLYDGRIVAMRACRERSEASPFAGLF